MNQILEPQCNISFKKNKHFYLYQFLISCFFIICFLSFLFIRVNHVSNNGSLSDELTKTYQLSTLYVNNTEYSAQYIEDTISSSNSDISNSPFVIGMLKIDKIGLNYPIISHSNKELLDISICRFAGPMPNEPGNLCIAGHNYVDYKFFSRLNELQKNDRIKLYDLNGEMKEYIVFKKYEIKPNNTSCTSQDTNGKLFLTLLTCNNVTGKRLVLVSKSI